MDKLDSCKIRRWTLAWDSWQGKEGEYIEMMHPGYWFKWQANRAYRKMMASEAIIYGARVVRVKK